MEDHGRQVDNLFDTVLASAGMEREPLSPPQATQPGADVNSIAEQMLAEFLAQDGSLKPVTFVLSGDGPDGTDILVTLETKTGSSVSERLKDAVDELRELKKAIKDKDKFKTLRTNLELKRTVNSLSAALGTLMEAEKITASVMREKYGFKDDGSNIIKQLAERIDALVEPSILVVENS